LPYLAWGILFGFLLSRSGAARFDYIHGMFLFTNLTLYGVICGAIAVAAPGMWLMRRMQKAGRIRGSIPFPRRRMTPGTLPGAALFGLGWAVSGTCPGPAAVQLGEGHWVALATIAGILLGNSVYAAMHRRWFKWRVDTCT
jgi:uncharacterized membrane protein YedE/YeeE